MKDKTFLSISQKNTSNAYIFWIQRSMFTAELTMKMYTIWRQMTTNM